MISQANRRIIALLGFSSVLHAGALLAYGYLYPQASPAMAASPTLRLQLHAVSAPAIVEVVSADTFEVPEQVLVTQSQRAAFSVQPQRPVSDLVVPSSPVVAKTPAAVSAVAPSLARTEPEPSLIKAARAAEVKEAVDEIIDETVDVYAAEIDYDRVTETLVSEVIIAVDATDVAAGGVALAFELDGSDLADSARISSQLGEQLLLALESYFNYPLKARRKGWQGEVRLNVAIGRRGQVETVQLASSSGYAVLDQAALKSMSKVGEIDLARLSMPLTDQLLQQSLQVEIPVAYRLVN